MELLLFDPQTSGGLLIAVGPEHADGLVAALTTFGVQPFLVGTAVPAVPGARITIV